MSYLLVHLPNLYSITHNLYYVKYDIHRQFDVKNPYVLKFLSKICRDGYLWIPRGHRYDADYLNKLDFLQRSNNWHESRAALFEAEIKNLHDLVDAS
ncbi:hypothetical protein C1E23_16210 [Pseudoalteromonas phenolica]|uniref:Uncharacterized protein n=1 Tax=Pseudoalteromonas phenolica TaxID=161398 RepID=A0A4Q7IKT2_9GAMM|nr:hypothetical protein C1E23_16210 [Pseudoalteromonas phenolica]